MITYKDKDTNGKLMQNLWNVVHVLQHTSGGRGSQNRILTILLRNRIVSQAELTEHLGIQSGSASEVLSKLESAGLIVRTESEEDRRTVNITLT
ncbi:MAG: MarR family transcriptional regulator, partial [Clostridiaceae bacterium]|nr:MarR family transcriptional regulator [Clostridiaceae bacterium]